MTEESNAMTATLERISIIEADKIGSVTSLLNLSRTLATIGEKTNAPRVGDHSSPEELRELFGLSKKAFKRAAGRLLKQQLVELDAQGCLVKVRG